MPRGIATRAFSAIIESRKSAISLRAHDNSVLDGLRWRANSPRRPLQALLLAAVALALPVGLARYNLVHAAPPVRLESTAGVTAEGTADLTVAVRGLRNGEGDIRVALCHTPDCYAEQKGFLREIVVPAAQPSVEVRFADLPTGNYTVTMFHDEDADGQFDRNFLGFPEEGFGFSRDARPGFSAPDYDRVVLRVGPDGLRTRLTVQYW